MLFNILNEVFNTQDHPPQERKTTKELLTSQLSLLDSSEIKWRANRDVCLSLLPLRLLRKTSPFEINPVTVRKQLSLYRAI